MSSNGDSDLHATCPAAEPPAAATRAAATPGSTAPTRRAFEPVRPLADPGARVAGLLRESAVIVAAATGLVYLMSDVYGRHYLAVFGVVSGFHGFGLRHLAMMPVLAYLGLAAFAWFLHEVLRSRRTSSLVGGLMVVVAVILAQPLIVAVYGAGELRALAGSHVAGGLLLCGALAFAHRRILPRMTQAEAQLAALDARCEQAAQQARRFEADLIELDGELALLEHPGDVSGTRRGDRPPAAERRRLVDRRVDAARQQQAVLGELDADARAVEDRRRARRRYAIGLWIACGFVTIAVAMPALATLAAVDAARGPDYTPSSATAPEAPLRRLVYWLGDRLVYITSTDDAGCLVHVRAGAGEQMTRPCSPLVTAIVTSS